MMVKTGEAVRVSKLTMMVKIGEAVRDS